ncbi:hypothetical protein D9758_012662 [Tetrapyrgos nigripes]|uniref:Uncharacterized protein n=1 Tax=Tetrapyrgos nigripes TaxID=182062 RepID=A0A8H5LMI5_9AGAR|nr:hypothetical protein D9758_012662 [Tetrapyrgos nigripes]
MTLTRAFLDHVRHWQLVVVMPLPWGTGTPRVMVTQHPPDDTQYSPSLINVFIAFQLIGLIGFIITFIVALFSSVRRHPTWYNFLASWIISCFSYALLFFGGELNSGDAKEKPSMALCMTQASLIYAAPPFAAATTLGLVVQIWFTVRSMVNPNPMLGQRYWTSLILILPWLLWISVIAESVGFALGTPSSVRRTGSGMYCNTGIRIPGRVSAVLAVLMLIPAVVFEALIIFALRRNWPAFKVRKNTMSMIIRVFGFSIFGVFALILSLFFIFTIHHGADLNIVVATIPVAALLIFGSQRDLLNVYLSLIRLKKPSASPGSGAGPVQLPPTPPPPPPGRDQGQIPSPTDPEKMTVDLDVYHAYSVPIVPFQNSRAIRDSTISSNSTSSVQSGLSKSSSIVLSVDTTFSQGQDKKLPPLPGTFPEDALQDEPDLYSATSPRSPHQWHLRRGVSTTRSIRKTLRPSSQQSLLSIAPWRFSSSKG